MSSSSSGRHINGRWIPSNQPKANISAPLFSPAKVRRGSYASKTKKPGLKEAIKAAFEAGNRTIKEVSKEILTKGFQLSPSSINTIMREVKVGKRNKKRAKKKPLKKRDLQSKSCMGG